MEFAEALQRQYVSEAQEMFAQTTWKCPLCLEETDSFDDSVQLDCSHRFCCTCVFNLLRQKVQEKRVAPQELCCPIPGCEMPFTTPQVEAALRQDPKLFPRFLDIRLESWRPEGEDERRYTCPSLSCAFTFLAPSKPGEAQLHCPNCATAFCVACGAAHAAIVSCEAHAAANKAGEEERTFEACMIQHGWQRCPKCSAPCERSQGCNYMTCESSACRRQCHFCYLCGMALSGLEHFSHFPAGAYENSCKNVDPTQDIDLPKATYVSPVERSLAENAMYLQEVLQIVLDRFGDPFSTCNVSTSAGDRHIEIDIGRS